MCFLRGTRFVVVFIASEASQCFFLREKVCCIWFYVFLIDVMRFFVYYRERDTFGFCNGGLRLFFG